MMLKWLNKKPPAQADVQRSETETCDFTPGSTVQVKTEAIGSSKDTKKTVTRYKALTTDHFVKFNWLRKKSNGDLICYLGSTRPDESRANDSFVKGWTGAANGYKLEIFSRQNKVSSQMLSPHRQSAGPLKFRKISMSNYVTS